MHHSVHSISESHVELGCSTVYCCCMFYCRHNTEKVIYFLLLDRKVRNPSCEDDEEIRAKSDSGTVVKAELLYLQIKCNTLILELVSLP